MARFSDRMSFRPAKAVFQFDSMDNDLRNSLWNTLSKWYFPDIYSTGQSSRLFGGLDQDLNVAVRALWIDEMKLPVGQVPYEEGQAYAAFQKHFLECPWYTAYDFIEAFVQAYPGNDRNQKFIDACNDVLKREMSAYRFIGQQIVRGTSEQELAAIEDALAAASTHQPIYDHLHQALTLLSDRQVPDYRNSMKEAISAVEALCRLIAGQPKATLGSALTAIVSSAKVGIHSSLSEALRKLYDYTNDDVSGIRHALKDEPTVDYEDAMFMLTTCSAYVSYMLAKAQKAGIVF